MCVQACRHVLAAPEELYRGRWNEIIIHANKHGVKLHKSLYSHKEKKTYVHWDLPKDGQKEHDGAHDRKDTGKPQQRLHLVGHQVCLKQATTWA